MTKKIILFKEKYICDIKFTLILVDYYLQQDHNLYQIQYKRENEIVYHSQYFTNIVPATNHFIKIENKFFNTNK